MGFTLAREGRVELSLVDVAGRDVASLRSGRFAQGRHELRWHDAGISPGVYQAVLRVNGRIVDSERLVVVK